MTSIYSLFQYIPFIAEGILWTTSLVLGGLSIGFIIGLPLAIAQNFGGKRLGKALNAYVWFFRGTPLLVLLSLFYWAIFPSFGFKLDPLETSILVLGMRSGAYQSQIFRDSIRSVDHGQILAARAIGMTQRKLISYIILPQALRISIPAWSNEYAVILKDSAICFALGVMEILTRVRYVSTATGLALVPYLFAGVLFFVLTFSGTGIMDFIYRRTKIPGMLGGRD